MPTYDYECPKGHRFELFQRISDEPGADCPECGEPAERKISGGAGFLFKGDGFYITDYRSDDYKKKASAEAPKKAGGGEGSAGSPPASSSGGSGESAGGSSSPSSSTSDD